MMALFVEAIDWLIAVSVQFTVLAVVLVGLEAVGARWLSARVRLLLWTLLFARLLLPTHVTLSGPWPMPTALVPVLATPAANAAPALAATVFATWFGVGVAFALGGGRRIVARRRAWRAAEAPVSVAWRQAAEHAARGLGLVAVPTLRACTAIAGPCVDSALRPVVWLPAHEVGWSEAQRVHVLLHEFAHVRRRDPAWQLVCVAIATLFWFHPVVWFGLRRLALLRELRCDADALRVAGAGYAATLRAVARELLTRGRAMPAPALGLIGRRHPLVVRLLAITRAPSRHWAGALVATTATVLLASCAMMVAASAPAMAGSGSAAGWLRQHVSSRSPGCLPRRFLTLAAMVEAGSPPAGAR